MNAKSQFNETVIANSLVAIFERLAEIEKSINILAAATSSIAKPHAELLGTLARLTLKRHAVLTATLMGASYQEIADKLGCDTTTIKLQLKAALEAVGIKSRTELRLHHSGLLDPISDEDYRERFQISKRWWIENNPTLLSVLRDKKAAHNQHVKPL